MSAAATGATALRVLTQLRRDPRTVALLLFVPAVLITLLRVRLRRPAGDVRPPRRPDDRAVPVHHDVPRHLDHDAARAHRRHARAADVDAGRQARPARRLRHRLRRHGRRSRRRSPPPWRSWRSGSTSAARRPRSWRWRSATPCSACRSGCSSARSRSSEFQAVQFMPAFILPQLLLCGLFVARDQMAGALEPLSDALPLTYAFDALDRVAAGGEFGGRGWLDVTVILGVTLLALGARRAHAAPPDRLAEAVLWCRPHVSGRDPRARRAHPAPRRGRGAGHRLVGAPAERRRGRGGRRPRRCRSRSPCVRDGRVGTAVTTDVDDPGLARAAAGAARLAASGPEAAPLPEPGPPGRSHDGYQPLPIDPADVGEQLGEWSSWRAGAAKTAIVSTRGVRAYEERSFGDLRVRRHVPGRSLELSAAAVSAGDLDPAALGAEAEALLGADAAIADVGPGEYPVVLGPWAVAEVVRRAALAFGGPQSPLADRLGTRVAAPAVNLSESPRFAATLPRSYDAQGSPRQPLPLIQDGVAHRLTGAGHRSRAGCRRRRRLRAGAPRARRRRRRRHLRARGAGRARASSSRRCRCTERGSSGAPARRSPRACG